MSSITYLAVMSNNPNKLSELRVLLENTRLQVVPYHHLTGSIVEVIEDGETYSDNALKKVLAPPERPDCLYLADDSALEVTSLNGEPGVYSARYSGPDCTYEDNCNKILRELKPHRDRSAQLCCTIALRFPQQYERAHKLVYGVVRGSIIEQWEGLDGFGYDPIFRPEGYTQTFATLPLAEKNKISHRRQAIDQAKAVIHNFLKQIDAA